METSLWRNCMFAGGHQLCTKLLNCHSGGWVPIVKQPFFKPLVCKGMLSLLTACSVSTNDWFSPSALSKDHVSLIDSDDNVDTSIFIIVLLETGDEGTAPTHVSKHDTSICPVQSLAPLHLSLSQMRAHHNVFTTRTSQRSSLSKTDGPRSCGKEGQVSADSVGGRFI